MASSFFGIFRSANPDDPLDSVKSVQTWAAALPANDPVGALEAIVHVLETVGTTRPEVNANRLPALIALDRLSLPMQAEVQNEYRLPALSAEVRRRLWHTGNDLARWFAYAYEQIYGAARAHEDGKKPRLPLYALFSRMFYYRGVQAKLGLFHYESWIPGSWKFLHNAYQEARAQNVATEPFSLVESAGLAERFSAEHEFLQILLLQRVNSGNLTADQVEGAAQWLRSWVQALKLSEPPIEGDGYWLDLGQGEGLLASRPAKPAGELLYLDIAPLRKLLGALIVRLGEHLAPNGERSAQHSLRVMEEQLKLAMSLDQLWRPHAPQHARRGERSPARRSVVVAAGWAAIVAAMASGRRPDASHQYSFDDATNLAVHGHLRNVQGDRYGTTIQRNPDRKGWQVHDTSESGLRILSSTREAQKQQVGTLLALQVDTDTRWQIGIVRRLRRRTAEHTELGVEVIARQASAIMVVPTPSRTSGYSVDGIDSGSGSSGFYALDLPPQQHARFPPVRTIVLPAAEYIPGRSLSITVAGNAREIRLFAPLEQTRDWVWTAFEVMAEAKRN